jgi:hypothetical protein
MLKRMIERSWVSPVTVFSFLVLATTGLLMLFHLRLPGVKGVHEWMGVVFAAAGLLHILLNCRPLLACLRRGSAAVALGVALALCVAALVVPGDHGRPGSDRHPDRYLASPSHNWSRAR